MKKLLIAFSLFIIGLLGGVASAQQTTAVSVQVQDSTGQLWFGGTISYIFQPLAGFNGQYYWGSNPLPDSYRTLTTVALDGSAQAAFTLPSSSDITPAGTGWSYKVCAWATTPCVTVPIPTSGATQNISAIINSNLNPISAPVTSIPLAYQSSEIKTVVNAGGIYYDTTQRIPMYYDGTNWLPFTSSPVTGAFLLNPSQTQTVTMPSTKETVFIGSNCPNCTVQLFNINTLNPNGSVTKNLGNWWTYNVSGPGRANGYGSGIASPDRGFDNQEQLELDMTSYRNGISTLIAANYNCFHVADCNGGYIYMTANGGQMFGSDEGISPWHVSLNEDSNYYNQLTTSTGVTQDPALPNGFHFNVGSPLLDTSQVVASGNLAGTSILWNPGSGTTYLPIAPVSNTVTPSTAWGQTTTYINASPAATATVITQSVTVAVAHGAYVNGQAWQASNTSPESIIISNAGAVVGGFQTFNVTGHQPAAIGSWIIQGGTNGFMKYNDDFTKAGIFTTFTVYGAPDSSHVFFAFSGTQGTYGYGYPIAGAMAETNTSPYTIYPGAFIDYVDQNGLHPHTQPTNFAYVSGDVVQNPHLMARFEHGIQFSSGARQIGSPANASDGIEIGLGGGGESYSADTYLGAINIKMGANALFYNCTNVGCGNAPGSGTTGWLRAPDMIFNGNGPFGTILTVAQPVNGNSNDNCPATVICILNDNTQNYNIFSEKYNTGANYIKLSRNLGGAGVPGIDFGGYVGAFSFLASSNGYAGIKASNLPVDTTTIGVNGSVISTIGYTGTFVAGSVTCTVNRGTISGCV